MNALQLGCSVLLLAILAVETLRGVRVYRKLQEDLAAGVPGARIGVYRQTLVFEWGTAALALMVLLTTGARPGAGFEGAPLLERFASFGQGTPGFWVGFGSAVMVMTAVTAWLSRRKAAPSTPSRWKKWLPDFGALLPQTPKERLWFAAVAISAGVCEEIVFRAWLPQFLHLGLGVSGAALLLFSVAGFALAHAYQGPAGVLATAYLAVLFTGIVVSTGSLLIPIGLHVLIDLRAVFTPTRLADVSPVVAT